MRRMLSALKRRVRWPFPKMRFLARLWARLPFSTMKLSAKLPAIAIASAILAATGVGAGSYVMVRSTAIDQALLAMDAITTDGSESLHTYFDGIRRNLEFMAADPMTRDAVTGFSSAWATLEGTASDTLQAAYIANNPNPDGAKQKLDASGGGTGYDTVHARFHPLFRKLQEAEGYDDIYLFDTNGNLLYSVAKGTEFATNVNTGEWKDTDLGNAYRAAADSFSFNPIQFFDFKPYAASGGAPASFISTPVVDDSGNKIGVLAYRMPVDRLNAAVHKAKGLGETGELMLVGPDRIARTDSPRTPENDVLKTHFKTPAIDAAISGKVGSGTYTDETGQVRRIIAEPFEFNGTPFAFVMTKSVDELFADVRHIRNGMLLIGLVGLTLAGLLGWFAAHAITGQINALVGSMRSLADGETDIELHGETRGDEIGDMVRAVAVFRDNAVERNRLEADQKGERERQNERQDSIQAMIAEFEGAVQSILDNVGVQIEAMEATANDLTAVAGDTSGKAGAAAAASEEASTNVQTVAAASEQLASSIGDILQKVAQTADVVAKATAITEQTNREITGLSDAAQKIGDVVSLIQDIAGQTNLLALNATIEAARAGELGKGFAVVASEVKSLASQTARATEEIATQIAGVQASTTVAVDAVGSIADVMREVNEYTATISAAVEQQGSATTEISGNIQQAARGTGEVATNVAGVTASIDETTQSAQQVQLASTELSAQSEQLRRTIGDFLKNVAAA